MVGGSGSTHIGVRERLATLGRLLGGE